MVRVVMRLVGALLALAGLALAAVGVWFATQLGGTGTATFTASPGTARPIVLPPDVLNRVDADVTVTATPGAGGRVWMALANPSDASAVLGDARHLVATGVDVGDWLLLTEQRGTAQATDLAAAELWRDQDDADEPVSMTVRQVEAPEAVVVVAEEGTVSSVTMTINDKTWFVEAVVAALVGLFLLVVGLVLAWPRRRPRPAGARRRRRRTRRHLTRPTPPTPPPPAPPPPTAPPPAPPPPTRPHRRTHRPSSRPGARPRRTPPRDPTSHPPYRRRRHRPRRRARPRRVRRHDGRPRRSPPRPRGGVGRRPAQHRRRHPDRRAAPRRRRGGRRRRRRSRQAGPGGGPRRRRADGRRRGRRAGRGRRGHRRAPRGGGRAHRPGAVAGPRLAAGHPLDHAGRGGEHPVPARHGVP